MSKQEEIKQALAAATPSQGDTGENESTHNRNPYFTNKQLEELSEYFKTIPVDEEGQPYEPEYNSMAVRSDILKMISDVWQARRKQYEVEFERDRIRKELEEARKISFPRQPDGKYGWTIDFSLLRKIQQLKSEYPCNSTLEEIESVLLVLEAFWGQEGEGNQDEQA